MPLSWGSMSAYGCAIGRALQQLAGIHQVVRIKRLLDPPHQVQLDRRLALLQLVAPQLADAMLGADRSAELLHLVMDDRVHRRRARQEVLFGLGLWLHEVEVD